MKKHTAFFAATALVLVTAARADEEDETAPAATVVATASSNDTIEYRRASLSERSPFARSERSRRGGGSGDSLELRGFFGEGETLKVSLTRPDTKESAWVSVGDKNAKWVVEKADADAGTADVNFDGLRLHLTLAKAELPEVTEGRRGGGRFGGNMSEEGRQALRDAMRSGFERARTEHPEWFDGRTLTPEQQQARTDYMRNGWNQAREAVSKISAVDAQQMSAEPPFMVGGGNPGGGGGSGGTAGSSSGTNNSGSNNNAGNTRGNRGNFGGNTTVENGGGNNGGNNGSGRGNRGTRGNRGGN